MNKKTLIYWAFSLSKKNEKIHFLVCATLNGDVENLHEEVPTGENEYKL